MTDSDRWAVPTEPPIGTRIRLLAMPEDPDPIESGATGTIRGYGPGQLLVEWDNGRSLHLIPRLDTFAVIPGGDDAHNPA